MSKDTPASTSQTGQLPECERDGFPILKINEEERCLAEYVDACIGNQKVTDVILRDDTLYYVFESRHELPLLCYCCGEALACPDLRAERKHMRGRVLRAMTWSLEELEDGRVVIDYQLEFTAKYGEEGPLMVRTSTLSADRMRHPVTCANSGVPDSRPRPVPADPVPAKRKRHRRGR
jgi:hypothetical protein